MNQSIILTARAHSIEGGSYVSVSLRNGKTSVDNVIKSQLTGTDALLGRAVELMNALGVKCNGCTQNIDCSVCPRSAEKASSITAVFNLDGENLTRIALAKNTDMFNSFVHSIKGLKLTVNASLKEDTANVLEVTSSKLMEMLAQDGISLDNQSSEEVCNDEEEVLDWLGGGVNVDDIHVDETPIDEDLSTQMQEEEEVASEQIYTGTSYRDDIEAEENVFITDPFGNQMVIEKPETPKVEKKETPKKEFLNGFISTGDSSYTTSNKESYVLSEEKARTIFALPKEGQGSFYAMNSNVRKVVAKDIEIFVATDREYIDGTPYAVALAAIKKGQTTWFCYSALQTSDLHEVASQVLVYAINAVMTKGMVNNSITVHTSVYNYNKDLSSQSFSKGPVTNKLFTYKDRLSAKGVNLQYKYQSRENQSYMHVGANMTLTLLLEQNNITRKKK